MVGGNLAALLFPLCKIFFMTAGPHRLRDGRPGPHHKLKLKLLLLLLLLLLVLLLLWWLWLWVSEPRAAVETEASGGPETVARGG